VSTGQCSVQDSSHSPGRLKKGMCERHYTRWHKYGDPLHTGRGEEHHGWQGDNAKYIARHQRVWRARGKALGPCHHCGDWDGPFEWALVHDGDQFDVGDYMELCSPCHHNYDHGGERSHYAKLTAEQVREIRTSSDSRKELQARFNVSKATIGRIIRGEGWEGVLHAVS